MIVAPEDLAREAWFATLRIVLRVSLGLGGPLVVAWFLVQEEGITVGAFATGASWSLLSVIWVVACFVARRGKRDTGIEFDRRFRR